MPTCDLCGMSEIIFCCINKLVLHLVYVYSLFFIKESMVLIKLFLVEDKTYSYTAPIVPFCLFGFGTYMMNINLEWNQSDCTSTP